MRLMKRSGTCRFFPVFNKNIPHKTRLVWDAAACVDGISLNSCLYTGPDITSSLVGVLLRFRQRKIGVTGDIEEMFLRITINKKDQHCQRFVWDGDVYVVRVLIFGSTVRLIRRNTLEIKMRRPLCKNIPRQ